MIDFNFKYSNVFSRADVAAYKALDGSIYITVAIHPFDGRDSVIRCCARYLPGEGRSAAMDFQAIVTGEFDLRERFGSISVPADADMLALCRVNPDYTEDFRSIAQRELTGEARKVVLSSLVDLEQ